MMQVKSRDEEDNITNGVESSQSKDKNNYIRAYDSVNVP